MADNLLMPEGSDPYYGQKYMPSGQELRAYQPTWRDRLGAWFMGDEKTSPEYNRMMEGLIGSRGLGETGPSAIDFTPAGIPLGVNDAWHKGDDRGMAMAIFGGPMAKTADRVALKTAEEMAAKGLTREQIFKDTGWFRGVDGKWRFEIDDSGAAPAVPVRQWIERRDGVPMAPSLGGAYSSAMAPGANGPLKLQSLLSHGELKTAYPDIMSEPTSLLREGSPSLGMYGKRQVNGDVRNEFGFNEALNPNDFKSVALHEGQHAIQDREAMARGGSLNGFTPEQIKAERSRILAQPDDSGWTTVGSASGDMSDKEVARRLYNRLAGEVEARTVQKRMDLTPDQRRARPPWLDYDVPEQDQIVRFGGSGPQMSMEPPPGIRGYHGSPHDPSVDEAINLLMRGYK